MIIRDFVAQLARKSDWQLGPPIFVYSRQAPKPSSQGDMEVVTIGGCLELYSALPPWNLPRETDAKHLEEVSILMDELCRFSRQHGVGWEIELDRDLIGSISDGKMDRSLAEGFIGEWRRQLNSRL